MVAPGRIMPLTAACCAEHLVAARLAPRAQALAHLGVRGSRRSRAASSAALAAPGLPMASVPTGTPAGICTIESSASMPLQHRRRHRHAEHRHRASSPPPCPAGAPRRRRAAMITFEPARLRASRAYSNIQSGVRCAETTRASCGTPSSSSSAHAGASMLVVALAAHDHADERRWHRRRSPAVEGGGRTDGAAAARTRRVNKLLAGGRGLTTDRAAAMVRTTPTG